MKKIKLIMLTIIALATVSSLHAQSAKLLQDSRDAKAQFIKGDNSMKNLFANSHAYVIFPNVGKGAVVVGAASGNGIVYQNGRVIGTAKMTQVTAGAQAGGQAYREVIFFENKDALDRFKDNKVEFSGQVSAVAVKSGASADAKYADGVQVYTQEKGGLMLEASLGGQKFAYKSK